MQQPLAGTATDGSHYVDWCTIFAGAALAAAISIVLFTFGTAIGLSMVSPYEGEGASTTGYLIALGLWTIWVVVSSFMAGGYLAGRMRRRIGDATEHEVEMRDGAHGLIVWAAGLVAAALLMAVGVSGVLGVTAKSGAGVAAAATASKSSGMTDYALDTLLRPSPQAAPQTSDASGESDARGATEERAEIARMFTYGLKGGALSADNRTYLARVVANRTGLTQAEAEQRVTQVIADTKAAADKARKAGILIGFITAATLLIGGAAAAWAAALGGRHRDQGSDLSAFWRWPK